MTQRTLLAVLAHPDDETFGIGGTLAHYARQGVHVHLICATRGEVGEAPPDRKGFASVGEMRTHELQCASKILGLESVYFLGYRDSGMAGSPDNQHPHALVSAPLDEVAHKIAAHIRRLRPQVVITSDPIGGYGHPDHIAIHRATVKAFHLAEDVSQDLETLSAYASQKLYFSTFSRRFVRAAVQVLRFLGQDPRHLGKNRDIDLEALVEADFPIHARISIRDVIEQKERAAACHSSQGGNWNAPARFAQRLLAGEESFMRAVPSEPPAHIERDLFEGVSL